MYLERDIQLFVMYCVNGEYGSTLLIESTDSMITLMYRSSRRIPRYCEQCLKGSYQGNVEVDRTECGPTTKEFTFQVTVFLNLQLS